MVTVNTKTNKAIVDMQTVKAVRRILKNVLVGELRDIQPNDDGNLCPADEIKSVLNDALARLDDGTPHVFYPRWMEYDTEELEECANVISDGTEMMYPGLPEYSEHDVFEYSDELVTAEFLLRGRWAYIGDELTVVPDEYWPKLLNPNI